MKNLQNRLASLTSQPSTIPLALFAVTILAYGLFFWRLGFYWDDLPISWIRYQLGTEATTLYFSDSRPVWALLYQLTGFALPLKPAVWQLFALFWRWAGVYAFYLVIASLFPKRKDMAFLLSLLILLYPGFNQQWVSYVYSHFFIVLFFLLISWHLMLRGKTIPAMIFSALHLLMFEYFFLLEFMRPVILFLSMRDEVMTNRGERLIKVFKAWLPYIGVIIFVLLYRSLVYSHPGFGYSLTDEIAKAPVETISQLVGQVLSGLWVAAVGAWMQAFQFPNPALSGPRTTVLYAVVVLLIGVFIFLINRTNESQTKNTRHDTYWLLGLGIVMLLMGGVPYWVTNLPVTLGFPANRALLSFMFGSCFLLFGLIDLLPARLKYLVAILFVSLSAGRQFLWSMDYLRDWESQKNMFWQLTWRAPGLKPGTLLLMNEELLFNADNSISAPLNWIYKTDSSTDMDYFIAYPTNRLGKSLASLEKDVPIRYDYIAGRFDGNTSEALAFYYDPPSCLRLLEPDLDSRNRFIHDESLMREASALSNADRILAEQQAVMPAIYGPDPEHGWCYYFQKADLARQFGDWDEVVKLGDKAFKLDDHPNNPVERFVFIEGYAHVGDWDRAIKLSKESYRVSKDYVGPLLCQLWKRIAVETAEGPGRSEVLAEAQTMFICNP